MVTIKSYAKLIQEEYTSEEKLKACAYEPMTIWSARFLTINFGKGFFEVHSLNCSCSGTMVKQKFNIMEYKSIRDYCGDEAAIQYSFHCILGDTCSE